MKKIGANGFTVVEAVLMVVVIGVVGFTGWYVVDAHKKADNLLKPNNSSVTITKKTNSDTAKELVIKEWGVKLSLGNAISGASYKLNTDDTGQAIDIIVPGSECSPMATIVRGKATDDDPTTDGQGYSTPVTYQKSPNSEHVGDYYYSLIDSNGTNCFKGEKEGANAGVETGKVYDQIHDAYKSITLVSKT